MTGTTLHSVPVGHKQAKKLTELLVWNLDSLSNALTTRILNFNDWFIICLLKSTANSAQVWWKWATLEALTFFFARLCPKGRE